MSAATGNKGRGPGCLLVLGLGLVCLAWLLMPKPPEVDASLGPGIDFPLLFRRLASVAAQPGPTRLLIGIFASLVLLVVLEHAALPLVRRRGGNPARWRLPSMLLAFFACALASVFTVGAVHELGWLSRTPSTVLLLQGYSPSDLETLEPVRMWAGARLGIQEEDFPLDIREAQRRYGNFLRQVRALQPRDVVVTNAQGKVSGVYFWFARPHPQVHGPGPDLPYPMPAGAHFSQAGARYAGTADLAALLAGISRERHRSAGDESESR